MATVSGINAQVGAIRRDLNEQRRYTEQNLTDIRNKISNEIAQYNAAAKAEVSKIADTLNKDYAAALRDMQTAMGQLSDRYEKEIDNAVQEIERMERESNRTIQDLHNQIARLKGQNEEERNRETARALALMSNARHAIEDAEKNTAILLLDEEGLEQLKVRLKKLDDYVDRSMYQTVIALSELIIEDVKVITSRMDKASVKWANDYNIYCESVKELTEKWNEIKEAIDGISEYGGVTPFYEATVSPSARNSDYVNYVKILMEESRVKIRFKLEDLLKLIREEKELGELIAKKSFENSICVSGYYIDPQNVKQVENKTTNFVLKINDVNRIKAYIEELLENVYKAEEGIGERYRLCDWLIDYLEEEEDCELIRDSREKETERESNFREQVVYTKLEFETADGSVFWINILNTNRNERILYLSHDGDCDDMAAILRKAEDYFVEEEMRDFKIVIPDDEDIETVKNLYFK